MSSDLATMEAIGAYDRPLYGRAREFVIPPLTPYETAESLSLPAADVFDAHLVTDGFPVLAKGWQEQDGDIWQYLETELTNGLAATPTPEELLAAWKPPSALHSK